MPLSAEQKVFLLLVKAGIGNAEPGELSGIAEAVDWQAVNWPAIKSLADKQCLSAVVLDGVDCLEGSGQTQVTAALDGSFRSRWGESVMFDYEYRHELYRRAIAEMADFYGEHGLKMMVLKGWACSLDWPKPEHRPSGDIDIWMFGKYREADYQLSEEKGIKVDNSHHHHTVFDWRGFVVENHYDFINYHGSSSNREIEKELKRLGKDDSHYVKLYGSRVFLPSPDLHALFLLRHSVLHFTGANISLRNVLDWAFFIKKHGAEVNLDWLLPLLERYHMTEFFDYINVVCIEDLGFAPTLFPSAQCNQEIKAKVLSDILEPVYEAEEPEKMLDRIRYKYHRRIGNSWKQKMCYSESALSRFLGDIWNHLLKPSSI